MMVMANLLDAAAPLHFIPLRLHFHFIISSGGKNFSLSQRFVWQTISEMRLLKRNTKSY